MRRPLFVALVSAAFLAAPSAFATTIVAQVSGITDPDQTITFSEIAVSGVPLTDQYEADFGVEFTPGVSYFNSVSPRPNFSGAAALSFTGSDFSMEFTDVLDAVGFNMTGNFGSVTVEALLDGDQAAIFDHAFPAGGAANAGTDRANFFGFEGIRFNQVSLTLNGTTSIAMDNLATSVAPVPLPAGLPLLLAALGGLGIAARRKRAA